MVDVEDMNVLSQVAKDVIIYEQKYKNQILIDIIQRIDALEQKKIGVEMKIFLLQQMKNKYLNQKTELIENIFCSYTECITPSVLDSLYNEINLEKF